MVYYSEKSRIFVMSFGNRRFCEELTYFDPSENLQAHNAWAISLNAVPPVVIYRCGLFFYSYAYRYCRTFRLGVIKKSTLCYKG